MRAMVYRGPYKIRVEEKDIPALEHPNDAIVQVTLAAICGSDLPRMARWPIPAPRPRAVRLQVLRPSPACE